MQTKAFEEPPLGSGSAVGRVLAILECLAASRLPVKNQDIAQAAGLSEATVNRYLKALTESGYVYQEESSLRYGLTMRICRLSRNSASLVNVRAIASPRLLELAGRLDAGVCLAVANGYDAYYVDAVEKPSGIISALQHIGKNAPLHTTGSGKILLSQMPDSRVDEYIAAKGFARLTPHTIDTREALFAALAEVRAQGYAVDREECETGVVCISVPVYDYTERVFAGMSAFDQAANMTAAREAELLTALRQSAVLLSRLFGSSSQPLLACGADD